MKYDCFVWDIPLLECSEQSKLKDGLETLRKHNVSHLIEDSVLEAMGLFCLLNLAAGACRGA